MALNFQQVVDKIMTIGAGTRERQEALAQRRAQARSLLDDWADKPAELTAKVERARTADPSLRCALPPAGRLDDSAPEPGAQGPVTLLAADGSQVAPDRHASLLFSLVNVGAVVQRTGSGAAPEVFTDSTLLYADELYTPAGMLTEEAVEQQRDLAERRMLLDLAPRFPAPQIALTDGPVELWGAKGAEGEGYRHNLELHKSILSQLQARGVTVAGYVDKPGADLVVRTLEVATLADDQIKDVRTLRPLRGVSDRWLFGEGGLLPAGSRSAVFGLQSSSRLHYNGDLALHFFYLNVGDARHPALVRVEVPRWVAEDATGLDRLHVALLEQCRILGARPYPYLLHRAHETAVVKFDEKRQVEQLLALELRRNGGEVEDPSAKQSAKDLAGRTRTM